MKKRLTQLLEEVRFRFEDEKEYENFSDYKKYISKILSHWKLTLVNISKNPDTDDFLISYKKNGLEKMVLVTLNGVIS